MFSRFSLMANILSTFRRLSLCELFIRPVCTQRYWRSPPCASLSPALFGRSARLRTTQPAQSTRRTRKVTLCVRRAGRIDKLFECEWLGFHSSIRWTVRTLRTRFGSALWTRKGRSDYDSDRQRAALKASARSPAGGGGISESQQTWAARATRDLTSRMTLSLSHSISLSFSLPLSLSRTLSLSLM